ncbi:membrane dipeptidase [Sorangium sp. So ce1000]|uniref:membrane dipeptidase n=1 Tax=Sorangium sp. So ce1000 TaxID=3133325 RepID=UPI003F608CFF
MSITLPARRRGLSTARAQAPLRSTARDQGGKKFGPHRATGRAVLLGEEVALSISIVAVRPSLIPANTDDTGAPMRRSMIPWLVAALAAMVVTPTSHAQKAPPGIGTAPILPRPGPVPPVTAPPVDRAPTSGVWGFAELHAHLAAHLAYGSDANGNEGIFYGKPGMRLEDNSVATDLAPCAREKHSGFDADLTRHEMRQQLMQKVNQIIGGTHGSGGYPRFDSWPNAMNGNHQQMHVTWLKRAFDGGLRVLVASVVENRSFSALWNRQIFGTQLPTVSAADEMTVALRQIDHINKIARANSTWMEVVTSPAAARAAIGNNKLAIVLGTELDMLTVDQLIELKNKQGVRLVIPVHMADNSIGGTAVYGDVFNTHNYLVNRQFFHVVGDPMLSFRLGVPLYPRVEGSIAVWDGPGAIKPTSIDLGQYCALGYECCPPPNAVSGCIPAGQGHKNEKGLLNEAGMKRLMKEGLLIDLAHMSDRGQEATVTLAERFSYPLMDSHTGVRSDTTKSNAERAIRASLVTRMVAKGGVIGVGTGGSTAGGFEEGSKKFVFHHGPKGNDRLVPRSGGNPLHDVNTYARLTGEQKTLAFAVGPLDAPDTASCERIRLTVRTGGDDLRGGGDDAVAHVNVRGRDVAVPLSHGAKWGNNSTQTIPADMPSGTKVADIKDIAVVHTGLRGGGFNQSDNWNMDSFKVECSDASATLANLSGAPLMRFTGDNKRFDITLAPGGSGEIRKLSFTIRTGGDDLRGGNDNAIAVIRISGRETECPLNKGASWGNGSVNTVSCDLPAGTRRSAIQGVAIRTTFGGGIGGDNWNMASVLVSGEPAASTLMNLDGAPLVRFTAEQRVRHLYAPRLTPVFTSPEREPTPSVMRLWIATQKDDLRGDNDNAFAVITYRGGVRQEVPLNRGGKWGPESRYNVVFKLAGTHTHRDIVSFGIRTTFTGGVSGDNWDVASLDLEAVEDPIDQWGRELARIQAATGGGKVAIGSDLNGFAPQVPLTTARVTYPLTLPASFGRAVTLAQSVTGDRRFDVGSDGIAHVGMLPDFLAAAAIRGVNAAPIYRSAEDTIVMWEKAEAAARNVP